MKSWSRKILPSTQVALPVWTRSRNRHNPLQSVQIKGKLWRRERKVRCKFISLICSKLLFPSSESRIILDLLFRLIPKPQFRLNLNPQFRPNLKLLFRSNFCVHWILFNKHRLSFHTGSCYWYATEATLWACHHRSKSICVKMIHAHPCMIPCHVRRRIPAYSGGRKVRAIKSLRCFVGVAITNTLSCRCWSGFVRGGGWSWCRRSGRSSWRGCWRWCHALIARFASRAVARDCFPSLAIVVNRAPIHACVLYRAAVAWWIEISSNFAITRASRH